MPHSADPTVAIIGAGPYGLSIAAHLEAAGVDYRIFGIPMHSWRASMPKGMYLKSEGCASKLFDPADRYTLQRHCAEAGLPYGQYGVPVSLETFTQYGVVFQRRLVPTVETVMVAALDRTADGFELLLASGERVKTRHVVVATGIAHAAYLPAVLAQLPAPLRSHSSEHDDLHSFRGLRVIVIGGGQSALEGAALLRESGAEVRVLVRRPAIIWNAGPVPGRRSLYARVRRPMSDLGPGLGMWFYTNAPMVFSRLPARVRIARTRRTLGPAGAWWLRDRVEGRLPILVGHSVCAAERRGDQVLLHVQGPDGPPQQMTADHVIAATGYRFALHALPFLSERLRTQVRAVQQTPVLSPNFESSVRGLYFTGLASANQFGPVMRFVLGAGFTARRVTGHIAASARLPFPAASGRGPACREFLAATAVAR